MTIYRVYVNDVVPIQVIFRTEYQELVSDTN